MDYDFNTISKSSYEMKCALDYYKQLSDINIQADNTDFSLPLVENDELAEVICNYLKEQYDCKYSISCKKILYSVFHKPHYMYRITVRRNSGIGTATDL